MSEPVWPLDLPQRALVAGYGERTRDVLLRTRMDAGPPKVRRRMTAAPVRITCAYAMSQEQLDRFLDFHRHELFDGAIPVVMPHPRTGEAVRASLAAAEPDIAPLGRSDLFTVGLQIEVLP